MDGGHASACTTLFRHMKKRRRRLKLYKHAGVARPLLVEVGVVAGDGGSWGSNLWGNSVWASAARAAAEWLLQVVWGSKHCIVGGCWQYARGAPLVGLAWLSAAAAHA